MAFPRAHECACTQCLFLSLTHTHSFVRIDYDEASGAADASYALPESAECGSSTDSSRTPTKPWAREDGF